MILLDLKTVLKFLTYILSPYDFVFVKIYVEFGRVKGLRFRDSLVLQNLTGLVEHYYKTKNSYMRHIVGVEFQIKKLSTFI